MVDNSAVVLVIQGAYQTADFYTTFEQSLQNHGLAVEHPKLPTCSNPESLDFPSRTISDDVVVIRDHVEKLLASGREIVLFAHSYGGLVASEAITQSFSAQERAKKGLKGGVTAMIFCSALTLAVGATLLDTFGESGNSDVLPDGRTIFNNTETKLFNDLSPAESQMWAQKAIPHTYAVQKYKMTNAAWKFISTWYIVLDKDQTIPPQGQEMFAGTAGARIEHFDAGHEPFLSRPDDLALKIKDLIQSMT